MHFVELGADMGRAGLAEDGAHCGGDHLGRCLRDPGQDVAHGVHPVMSGRLPVASTDVAEIAASEVSEITEVAAPHTGSVIAEVTAVAIAVAVAAIPVVVDVHVAAPAEGTEAAEHRTQQQPRQHSPRPRRTSRLRRRRKRRSRRSRDGQPRPARAEARRGGPGDAGRRWEAAAPRPATMASAHLMA